MNETTPAIAAQGLSRDFGAVRALVGLSFSIPPGQVAGLLGHNGAGKTTAIRLLNGVISASAGHARVLGLDPGVAGPEIRARTGVLTETPSLDERLSARENLVFAAHLFGVERQAIGARVDGLLERFKLSDRAADRASGFSRGMKQRLALARALIHDPELIFLDEPTAALDPVAARDVHQLIRDYAREQGRTVVITTHNLVEAQRLCDRVIILRRGRAIADGSPAQLGRDVSASTRVEIEVGELDAEPAMAVARAALDGASVAPDGATVALDGGALVVSGLARNRLPALVRELALAGVAIYRVTSAEPSLEDVYFSLHEAGDQ
jgi:ABC-2 type transport system ATP-binding protein